MQINTQPSIRPVPAKRQHTGKLDRSNAVIAFDKKVQAANPKPDQQKQDKESDQDQNGSGASGGIDITA